MREIALGFIWQTAERNRSRALHDRLPEFFGSIELSIRSSTFQFRFVALLKHI